MASKLCIVAFAFVACYTTSTMACNVTMSSSDDLQAMAETLKNSISNESSSDYTICFEPGATFHLEKPLLLNKNHNHPLASLGGKILWKSMGDTPATMSAGLPLTNWRRCDSPLGFCPGAEWHGVWVHFVSDIVNHTDMEIPFRQFWVNDMRALTLTI